MNKILISLMILFLFANCCVFELPKKKQRKFVLVGGGKMPVVIRDKFLELAGGRDSKILVIPSASSTPEDPCFLDNWKPFVSVNLLHARDRDEAMTSSFYSRIKESSGVWISGGDQAKLIALYGGTPVVDELKSLLDRGGVIGGTSAGASIVGPIMPYDDHEMPGFGLFQGFIVDQHFDTRRERVHRLNKLIANHRGMTGIGIDEGTAFVVNGDSVDVIGNGSVYYTKR